MARQRMSEKKLRAINRLTGQEYISAWHRGGGDWRWVQCELPSSNGLANRDKVNRVTGEVVPLFREGRMIEQPPEPSDPWFHDIITASGLEDAFKRRADKPE